MPYVIGSPCCSVSYYIYISVWPYYIVIHIKHFNSQYLHLLQNKILYIGNAVQYKVI